MLQINEFQAYGFGPAFRGMRNPMNSWDKSDTVGDILGKKDLELANKLIQAGPSHCKFRRMIHATMDITAPLYWWKEFDTYRMGVEKNSCSTMHKIHAKPFELEDFSYEHVLPGISESAFMLAIDILNYYRARFVHTKDKEDWWQLIKLLPESYNQLRTVDISYEALAKIVNERSNHKLDEWHIFINECTKELPYPELFNPSAIIEPLRSSDEQLSLFNDAVDAMRNHKPESD